LHLDFELRTLASWLLDDEGKKESRDRGTPAENQPGISLPGERPQPRAPAPRDRGRVSA
jgi:hypothetical protein